MISPSLIHQGENFEVELTVQSNLTPSILSENIEKCKGINIRCMGRSVLFYVPESVHNKRNVPLLIAFHGSTETGVIFRTRTTAEAYDQLARELGFIIAYPSGYKGNWHESVLIIEPSQTFHSPQTY